MDKLVKFALNSCTRVMINNVFKIVEGMTHELSCLHILYDFLDEYLCVIMYHTSIIHFNLIPFLILKSTLVNATFVFGHAPF